MERWREAKASWNTKASSCPWTVVEETGQTSIRKKSVYLQTVKNLIVVWVSSEDVEKCRKRLGYCHRERWHDVC